MSNPERRKSGTLSQKDGDDAFDIDISPAVSAEEGLRIGPEVFARLPRMQQHG